MENKEAVLPYFISNYVPEENRNQREEITDREYFRQMYPASVKRYLRVIAEVLNRMDTSESYLYDEYPDKVRMERLTEIVLRLVPLEERMNRETQRNMIKVLLWEEVVYRRNQRREKITSTGQS